MTNGKIINYQTFQPEEGQPDKIVILLHGLGSNGADLISLAPYWASELSGAVFVSPDAPFACDMVPAGYPNSFQWFSLQSRDPKTMLEGAKTAAPILEKFIKDQCAKHNVLIEKCALVGFSQGTMMSLFTAPRIKEKIAGVMGYSGMFLWEEMENYHKLPVHLIHGESDDVLPVSSFAAAKEQLTALGFPTTGYTQPRLAHSIDERGIQSGGEFLSKILS